MKPAASGRYAPLADPPGPPSPPRSFRVTLRLDAQLDRVVPDARDEQDAVARAYAAWCNQGDQPLALAGFRMTAASMIGGECVEPLD